VDDSGHARIADFGLATVAQTMDSIRSTSHHDCSSRWTAPEILNGGPHNKQTDIFSFAMIMIEVRHGRYTACRGLAHCHFVSIQIFTGTIPFNNYVTIAAMLAVAKGERPPRPVHPTFTDTLWTLTQRCWDHTPHLRPEISEALEVLLIPSVPLHPNGHTFVSLTLSRVQRRSSLEAVDRRYPFHTRAHLSYRHNLLGS